MNIDLSQFYEVFFEETLEHLQRLETLLVDSETSASDDEALNAIFRAAHSIKGGAATFGFQAMANVTHELETLLDRVRNHEIPLSQEIVEASLQTSDILKAQVDEQRNGTVVDPGWVADTVALLRLLVAETASASVKTAAAPLQAAPAHTFRVELRVAPSFEMPRLLQSLESFGQIKEMTELKKPAEGWVFKLITSVNEMDLFETMAFVVAPDCITIIDETLAQQEAEQGFGLFDDPAPIVSSSTADSDFGFFDESPGAPAVAATDWGLFDDTPASVVVDAPPPIVAAVTVPVHKPSEKPAAPAETSIRVGVDKVDHLLNLVGELVITQSMLAQRVLAFDPVEHEQLFAGMSQLERNSRELQEAVMSIRMIPISSVFNRFPRVVRDVAQKLGKKVELKLMGESTELDKGLIEKLSDPLTHLVRNSLDHGIESPEVRKSRGKPETGTLTLRAFHEGGSIAIEVSDDGAGLNRERILNKARERGMSVNDNFSDNEVWQLIFEPGFSTADQVTDVSGRGVGMDVVRRNIQAMGGRIDIQSMAGIGSSMSIRLPLTLAIVDGMSIAVGDNIYIIPLVFIRESMQATASNLHTVTGSDTVIEVRGEYLPVIALCDVFNLETKLTEANQGLLIIVQAEGQRVALRVDDLLGQHQVVIKSLETNFRQVAGVSGATIMGDGRVALILDISSLVRLAQTGAKKSSHQEKSK